MATITVTTLDDEIAASTDLSAESNDGNGLSLREALAIASSTSTNHTINFASSLNGGTIALSNDALQITSHSSNITINGDINNDGLADITVDADNNSSVFYINKNAVITMDGLIITGGKSLDSFDSGIYVDSDGSELTIVNSVIEGNHGTGLLFNGEKLTINSSDISNNGKDGIQVRGAIELNISNSSFTKNGDNGIDLNNGTYGIQTTIENSTIAHNASYGAWLLDADQNSSIISSTFTGNGDGTDIYLGPSLLISDSIFLSGQGSNPSINFDHSSSAAFFGAVATSSTEFIPVVGRSTVAAASEVFSATETVNGIESGKLTSIGHIQIANIKPSSLPADIGATDPSQFTLNLRPKAESKSITLRDGQSYTFKASDFRFSDSDDGDTLRAIKIFSEIAPEGLKLNGEPIAYDNNIVLASDLYKLTFEPVSNADTNSKDGFSFWVSDGKSWSTYSQRISIETKALPISGTSSNDTISGSDADDVIAGQAGEDTIFGGDGNDAIWAGASDDGADRMDGGKGDDTIGGGPGNDTLIGANGSDQIFGGNGDDVIWSGEVNSVSDTSANTVWAGAGEDQVTGSAGSDTIGGGTGNDHIIAGSGDDVIFGGGGKNGGNDTLLGNGGDDRIYASRGNDDIGGGAGADQLYAGAGDDTVSGDDSDDFIYGGAGNDDLTGGNGADTFAFFVRFGNDTIRDFEAGDILEIGLEGFELSAIRQEAKFENGNTLLTIGDHGTILLERVDETEFQSFIDAGQILI